MDRIQSRCKDFWSLFLISLLSTLLSIITASVVLVQAHHILIYALFNATIYASILDSRSNLSIWIALREHRRPRQRKNMWDPLCKKLPGLVTNKSYANTKRMQPRQRSHRLITTVKIFCPEIIMVSTRLQVYYF